MELNGLMAMALNRTESISQSDTNKLESTTSRQRSSTPSHKFFIPKPLPALPKVAFSVDIQDKRELRHDPVNTFSRFENYYGEDDDPPASDVLNYFQNKPLEELTRVEKHMLNIQLFSTVKAFMEGDWRSRFKYLHMDVRRKQERNKGKLSKAKCKAKGMGLPERKISIESNIEKEKSTPGKGNVSPFLSLTLTPSPSLSVSVSFSI